MFKITDGYIDAKKLEFARRLVADGVVKAGTDPIITDTTLVAETYFSPTKGVYPLNFKNNASNKGNNSLERLLRAEHYFQPLYAAVYISKYTVDPTAQPLNDDNLEIFPYVDMTVFTDPTERANLRKVWNGARVNFKINNTDFIYEYDARVFLTRPPFANHNEHYEIYPDLKDQGFKRFDVNHYFNGNEDSIFTLTLGEGDHSLIDGDGILAGHKNKLVVKLFGFEYSQSSSGKDGGCPVVRLAA